MTRIVIRKLIIDTWNLEHIRKHFVTSDEVIAVGNNLVYHKRTYQGRYVAIGRSGRRIITMVLSRKGRGEYYLVTARDASKKEKRVVYEKEIIEDPSV